MKTTLSAGGVVLNSLGQVLVVSQHGNSWSLPKGHIDAGEDELAAAKREISEESGVQDLTFVEELGRYERYRLGLDGKDDLSENKRIAFFLFRTSEMKLKPLDPENPEARWVDAEKVADLLTHPIDKEFFIRVLPRLR